MEQFTGLPTCKKEIWENTVKSFSNSSSSIPFHILKIYIAFFQNRVLKHGLSFAIIFNSRQCVRILLDPMWRIVDKSFISRYTGVLNILKAKCWGIIWYTLLSKFCETILTNSPYTFIKCTLSLQFSLVVIDTVSSHDSQHNKQMITNVQLYTWNIQCIKKFWNWVLWQKTPFLTVSLLLHNYICSCSTEIFWIRQPV